MKHTFAIAVGALAASASAKKCQNITVPVTISARNGKYDQQALTTVSNIDVNNFILNLSAQGQNYTAKVLQGYETVAGTYNLATTYCEPDSGAPNTVQVLTHGIGFDRSYWNAPYNNFNYSYVNEAVDQYGYATLSWDRLGIAQSQHGEPVNEIQAFLEVEALKALTDAIRGGSVKGAPSYKKVVHIGHSFGSQHTYLLTAKYPDSSDGIALTGFSQNGSFASFFTLGGNFVGKQNNPALANYVNGYLAAGDQTGVQTNFFAPGDFDPNIVQFAFSTGAPVTVGELLSFGGETAVPNTFKGPVFIITGERDIPYCGGNCLAPPTDYPNIPSTSKNNFKDASNFEVYIVPGAGHGLNLEYTWPQTYAKINDFFAQNGNAANGTSTGPSSSAATSASSTATTTAESETANGRPTSEPSQYGGRGGYGAGGWVHGH